MSISFYQASVASYLQVLEGVSGVLDKGASFAAESRLDPQEMVMTRFHEDMMPLHFQIVSVAHHSWGALQAMQQGSFSPPSFELDMDYARLQAVVQNARDELSRQNIAEVDALSDKSMVFKLGKNEIPFSNLNFLLSVSLPNFYFHATTTFSILRMLGAPVGKMDYMGPLKMG
jgi:hypothetical protein